MEYLKYCKNRPTPSACSFKSFIKYSKSIGLDVKELRSVAKECHGCRNCHEIAENFLLKNIEVFKK